MYMYAIRACPRTLQLARVLIHLAKAKSALNLLLWGYNKATTHVVLLVHYRDCTAGVVEIRSHGNHYCSKGWEPQKKNWRTKHPSGPTCGQIRFIRSRCAARHTCLPLEPLKSRRRQVWIAMGWRARSICQVGFKSLFDSGCTRLNSPALVQLEK